MPRYGLSPWEDRARHARTREWPRLTAARSADVVVAGGGLTGALVALFAATAGRSVVLLDAARIGQGTTARAPGTILPWPERSLRELRQQHGLRAARIAFDETRAGAADLLALVRKLRIRCDAETGDYCRLALSPGTVSTLEREFRDLQEAGIDATWLDAARLVKQVRAADARVAIRTSGAGVLDPLAALHGVVRAAVRARVKVFEKSEVVTVEPGKQDVLVGTERGEVRAGQLVVATGGPGDLHRQLARHVVETDEYSVAVALPPAVARVVRVLGAAAVADSETPPHAWRWSGESLILTGGAQAPVADRHRADALIQRGGQLMYELSVQFPPVSGLRPSHVWTTRARRSADGLPWAGPHRNFPRQLFALACDASLSSSIVAARVVVRQLLGTATKADDVFGFGR